MIQRLSPLSWILAALALSLLLAAPSVRADGAEVKQVALEATDEGYRLSSTFDFELNRGLEDALLRGVPLYFTTEVAIFRPRWYWFDERTLRAAHTVRDSYNVLTRQYRAATAAGLQQNFSTLDDALVMVRRPSRWIVAPRGALKPGETYTVSVRMDLDVQHLPKPFQVNAINNSDWQLGTGWKTFTFRPDSR